MDYVKILSMPTTTTTTTEPIIQITSAVQLNSQLLVYIVVMYA